MYRKMHTVAAAVAAALASGTAFSADWELNPRIEAGYMVDDNYRLANEGAEIEVQGPLADAQLEMRARMPKSEFSFTPRIRATYFPDEQDLDTVDYFGAIDWQYHGQRVDTDVRGEYSQQDVVNSEQPMPRYPETPASVIRGTSATPGARSWRTDARAAGCGPCSATNCRNAAR